MSEIGLRSKMLVKDVMSSPVITIDEKIEARDAARLMDKHVVGCVIVTSKEKPIGIITERDLVVRVLAKGTKALRSKAKEIMSSPLITVDPDENIADAARRMNRLAIRRLGVIYKGRLVGIIASVDILNVVPELLEITREKALIESEKTPRGSGREPTPLVGTCDRCGTWSDTLRRSDGEYVCEECRQEQ